MNGSMMNDSNAIITRTNSAGNTQHFLILKNVSIGALYTFAMFWMIWISVSNHGYLMKRSTSTFSDTALMMETTSMTEAILPQNGFNNSIHQDTTSAAAAEVLTAVKLSFNGYNNSNHENRTVIAAEEVRETKLHNDSSHHDTAAIAAAEVTITTTPVGRHTVTKDNLNKTTTLQQPKKLQRPNQLYWKPNELKLPTPIIVMGMMKAGTTSIYGYFKCGLDPSRSKISHYNCHNATGVMSCGRRMKLNLFKFHVKAFDAMDQFDVYTELDAPIGKEFRMALPQWSHLEQIHDNFPNATWILNLRDPYDWLNSVNRWNDLRQRFIFEDYSPTLPAGKGEDDEDMITFYNEQAQRVRKFVKRHPSHTLVELQIDHDDAGQVMEDAFGIPAETCWKQRNVNHDGKAKWTEN